MKIIAIHGGGDWNDASAEYVVLPDGMNISEERKKYEEWYKTYSDAYRDHFQKIRDGLISSDAPAPQYESFHSWLLKIPGIKGPGPDELEVFYDG